MFAVIIIIFLWFIFLLIELDLYTYSVFSCKFIVTLYSFYESLIYWSWFYSYDLVFFDDLYRFLSKRKKIYIKFVFTSRLTINLIVYVFVGQRHFAPGRYEHPVFFFLCREIVTDTLTIEIAGLRTIRKSITYTVFRKT